MPSYRVTLTVGVLRPGTEPETVLPAATDVARALTTVESWDVDVVRGQARITVRFTGPDDDAARDVGRAVVRTVTALADATAPQVTRRWGARWYPLR